MISKVSFKVNAEPLLAIVWKTSCWTNDNNLKIYIWYIVNHYWNGSLPCLFIQVVLEHIIADALFVLTWCCFAIFMVKSNFVLLFFVWKKLNYTIKFQHQILVLTISKSKKRLTTLHSLLLLEVRGEWSSKLTVFIFIRITVKQDKTW